MLLGFGNSLRSVRSRMIPVNRRDEECGEGKEEKRGTPRGVISHYSNVGRQRSEATKPSFGKALVRYGGWDYEKSRFPEGRLIAS